ncbi:MAG: tRNA-dihydrouridine synthase, partial [Enterovibrio sp.]
VRVQLLGQSPQYMAENAALAIELGSAGVDLNFGCPSKTVNNSLGGAALLKQPELIYQIVKSVRAAIPHAKLSAKIRLGFDDCSPFLEIAHAALSANVDELVVHGRSKVDGYKKEAIRWDLIGEIQKRTQVCVIANGEIWDKEDAKNCLLQTGCSSLMVCRGALSMPNLAAHIVHDAAPLAWHEVVALLLTYAKNFAQQEKKQYVSARIKQWLHYLSLNYPQANLLFLNIKNIHEQELIQAALQNYLHQEMAIAV